MKQTYIKPNTKLHDIELTQMIAESPGMSGDHKDPSIIESKGDYILSSSDIWADDEEEQKHGALVIN